MRARFALALAVGGIALLGLPGSAAAATQITFGFTGASQTFTVPDGVSHVAIQALGAQGGAGGIAGGDEQGALGGEADGTLSVTPGEILSIYVGGRGGPGGAATGGWIVLGGPGGFNGGGAGGQAAIESDGNQTWQGYGGGGGGGASDVRQGGTGLADRVVIAGAGGGAAADCFGDGTGGGTTGDSSCGAGGGTQNAGGTGGAGATDGTPGTGGAGSAGNSDVNFLDAGGGGGGGLYGGGGGGGGDTGAGGSGYTADGTSMTNGVQSGNGAVTISWTSLSVQVPSEVAIADPVHATATLSGAHAPSGTITFNAYGPGNLDCVDPPAFTDTVTVSGGGASADFTATQLGTYVWVASYSGDANNDAAASACDPQNVLVNVVPNKPSALDSSPPSPANNNDPTISGTADAGSTVSVYALPDCSGSIVGSGSAADFGSPGLSVHVADNSTTTFSASATASSEDSACSTDTASYVEDSIIPTATIETKPSRSSNLASASFTYSSNEQGATFECKLDYSDYVSCPADGKSFSGLSDGSHTFLVRASDAAGNTGSAGSYTWTIDTTNTTTFSFTGGAQTFTVPHDVTRVTIDDLGAQGGLAGGNGGEATATISVTPGEVLQVNVGGQGGVPDPGFNGGGNGGVGDISSGGGGGGASDVRRGAFGLDDRIVIGGGGGGGTGCAGGAGAGTTGGAGVKCYQSNDSSGGGGGTQSEGGQGGNPGGYGSGGNGALNPSGYDDASGGGGGGGGFYGGAGGTGSDFLQGGNGGGGGGGSGWTPGGTGMANGVQSGNGRVTITHTPNAPAPDATTTSPPTSPPTGQRAAALKKCKHKQGKAGKKCKKRAKKLPV
jgi:hypothetical protein